MKVYRGLEQIGRPFDRAAVTIGNFDGVHLGHQALFRKVTSIARDRDSDSVAITFDPHPLKVLRPESPPKLISTLEQKIELIEEAGIEHLVLLTFTRELAATPAKIFIEDILYKAIGVNDLVVGYDYACGKGREGNISFLKEQGKRLGFNVHVVPPITLDGIVVSSSKVRDLVMQGEMRQVRLLLGRYYQIRGIVQVGKKRGGRVIGFPTANLNIEKEDLCPKPGVYVVQVLYDEQCYGGVLNIGYNPTFGDDKLGAETHIFDFNKNIYGHPIKVNLIQRIRDEKKFSGPEELARQIAKDVETARLILANEEWLQESCKRG